MGDGDGDNMGGYGRIWEDIRGMTCRIGFGKLTLAHEILLSSSFSK
jgi:hypothetical protein